MAISDTHCDNSFTENDQPLHLERAVEKKCESEYDGEEGAEHCFVGVLTCGYFELESLTKLIYVKQFFLYGAWFMFFSLSHFYE